MRGAPRARGTRTRRRRSRTAPLRVRAAAPGDSGCGHASASPRARPRASRDPRPTPGTGCRTGSAPASARRTGAGRAGTRRASPTLTCPSIVSQPPYNITIAVVIRPTNCTPGPYAAARRCDPHVRVAVAIVEMVEDLLVLGSRRNACTAWIPPRLSTKCTITSAIGVARRPVRAFGVVAEPAGEHPQDRERREHRDRELQVEQQQHDADADDQQDRRDERDDAAREHLLDRFDVGGLPRDHATRRVPLVERQAEPLEVHEDPAAEVEEHVLADATGEQQEAVERRRADDRDRRRMRRRPRRAAAHLPLPPSSSGGMPLVDAFLHEPWAGSWQRC